WLTGPAARQQVQLLRHASDAVLTGIGTVLSDDPQLTDRSGMQSPARSGMPRRRPLLRVVLDTHLRIPLDSQLVRSANINSEPDLLILCGEAASSTKRAALERCGAQVETVSGHAGLLSLPAVLSTLAERNILSLLLECGSHLNGAFLQHDLVDKAILFYSQTELGDQAIPFAQGIAFPQVFERSLARVTSTTVGSPETQDTCITGYLHYPWPNP
ncbi:MAG: RibD family protein, partial [Edaphobacter sp.]